MSDPSGMTDAKAYIVYPCAAYCEERLKFCNPYRASVMPSTVTMKGDAVVGLSEVQ